MTKASEAKTRPYVLIADNHFTRDVDGNSVEVKKGEIIQLTAAQAIHLKDKVKTEDQVAAEATQNARIAKALKLLEEAEANAGTATTKKTGDEGEEEEESETPDFDKMSHQDLVAYAKENELDAGPYNVKTEVLRDAVKEAYKAKADESEE